jgi:hypothetical protein
MLTNEYVDAVFQIISSNERPHGLKASTLGQLIRRGLPNESWSTFGFRSLKSLLLHLEQQSLIRTGDDDTGAFAVWVSKTTSVATPPQTQKYSPLRKDVWLAFVASQPHGKRFVDRTSGTVRMGLQDSPHPAEQWTEIVPIPETEQKDWARHFVATHCASQTKLLSTLTGPTWFTQFANELRASSPELSRLWNRVRSEKVSSHVKSWCEKHKIEPEIAFAQRADVTPQAAHSGPIAGSIEPRRAILLAAISKMSTDELVQLSIPARYLLREMGI